MGTFSSPGGPIFARSFGWLKGKVISKSFTMDAANVLPVPYAALNGLLTSTDVVFRKRCL
jgi:hypothetical protein